MRDYLFQWKSDMDGDGVPEAVRYSSVSYLPDVDPPTGGRSLRSVVTPTLGGGNMIVTQGRAGKVDQRAPARFELSWGYCDESFRAIAEEDHAVCRLVEVALDHRWRSLRVASSGLADGKVTVEPGPLDTSGGDTLFLSSEATVTLSAGHRLVYALATAGVLAAGSAATLPAGAIPLAEVALSGGVAVVVTDPSGAANARLCRVLECVSKQAGKGLTALRVVLQEVR